MEEKQITITKISLNAGMFPVVSYKEHLPGNDERLHNGVKCTAAAHDDLVKAFRDFTLDLALICEEISNEEYISALPAEYDATQPDVMELGEIVPAIKAKNNKKAKQLSIVPQPEDEDKIVDKFDIGTVEFKYKNGIESIALTGQKQLSTFKWMGLSAPDIKINENEYPYTSNLFEAGELLKHEMSLYILEHKYAPAKDPEFDFPDGPPVEEEQY